MQPRCLSAPLHQRQHNCFRSSSRSAPCGSRLAPSAARMPNSRARAVDRASRRLATFAHAMSKTRLTAPNSSNRVPFTSPTICCFSDVTHDADTAVRVRILTIKVQLNRAHFGPCLSHRHAGFQACEHSDCVHRTLSINGGHVWSQRGKDVRVSEKMESRGEHSRDCIALAIQDDGFTCYTWVRSKTLPPKSITYKSDWWRVHHVIRRSEILPYRGLHAQGRKKGGCDPNACEVVPLSRAKGRSKL